MKKVISIYMILSFFIGSCNSETSAPKTVSSNIVVYGDSEAAFVAAISAARLDKTVHLVSPSDHIGGFIINGLSSSDVGDGHVDNKRFVSGLPLEFYRRVSKYYGHEKELGTFGWEPHVGEKIIQLWLKEYPNIRIYRNMRLMEGAKAIKKRNKKIESIRTEDGTTFKASVFIDATIEGDLMAFAGISYVFGREGNTKYGESLNGIYPEQTYRQFQVLIDPYKIPGDKGSDLIPTVRAVALGKKGDPSPYIMGFCFRICLTDSVENAIPIVKPKNYDLGQYEIYKRYFLEGGSNSFFEGPHKGVPNNKTDLGSWHDLSANLYGMNARYPDGSYKERDEIYNMHKDFTLGLLYFLQNDESVPREVQTRWKRFGLPKDEFSDNMNWPYKFYARSARRMVSDYIITEHNQRLGAAQPSDPIGISFWPMDMHAAKRVVKNGSVWNEGFVFDKNVVPFGISYRALVPKKKECTNLLVAACPSSSYVGYSGLRLVWVFMTMGQAAGTAASIAIDEEVSVQNVDYNLLKSELNKMGQVLNVNFKGKPLDSND